MAARKTRAKSRKVRRPPRRPTPQDIENALLELLGVRACLQVIVANLNPEASTVLMRCAIQPLARAMALLGRPDKPAWK